jgi:hypothetical protein
MACRQTDDDRTLSLPSLSYTLRGAVLHTHEFVPSSSTTAGMPDVTFHTADFDMRTLQTAGTFQMHGLPFYYLPSSLLDMHSAFGAVHHE